MTQQRLFAIAVCLCSAAILITAAPMPAGNQELDLLQIPLSDGKEIDVLTLGAKDQEQLIADRNKRTIGLLRELFPDITKQIDDIVNRIIGQVIRVAGPSLLPALLGNNRPTTERTDFDADFDDDQSDDDTSSNNVLTKSDAADPGQVESSGASSPTGNDDGGRVSISLPTFPSGDEITTVAANKVSFAQGTSEATTGVATSTTAATTTTSESVTATTTLPTTTTPIITTITSPPIVIPTTPYTASAANPTIVATPLPTTQPPPTTTVDTILVIPRTKSQSTKEII